MRRVVVAPDKFKGSLTAAAAADAIAAGIRDVAPDVEIVVVPVADGGEGTLDLLMSCGGRRQDRQVSGPLGDPVDARYVVYEGTAFVEASRACGLEYVRPTPATALAAHTLGVGELLRDALERGATDIVLTVGGTAATDGGAGMLQALGARIEGLDGSQLPPGGASLARAALVDVAPVRDLLTGVRFRVAVDVTNPLVGSRGAAAVFGGQKGAGAAEVELLDAALSRWATLLGGEQATTLSSIPGGGAGGGLAAGAVGGLTAAMCSGFDLLADIVGLRGHLACADLVVTGEGSLDEQSLCGKAPAGVARYARDAGIPVVGVCGQLALGARALADAGIVAAGSLVEVAGSRDAAMRDASLLLRSLTAALVASG